MNISGVEDLKDPFAGTMSLASDEQNLTRMAGKLEGWIDDQHGKKELPPPPEAPEYHSTIWGDHAKQVGGILAVGAAFLGAMNNGAVGAMNSLSAALTGFHNGQIETGKHHLEAYKANMEAVQKAYKERIDAYKAIAADKNKTIQEIASELRTMSLLYKDKGMETRAVYGEQMKYIEHLENIAAAHDKQIADISSRQSLLDKKLAADVKKEKAKHPDSPFAAPGVPKALVGVTGSKGKDRFTDDQGKVWDWNYTTNKWEPHKA